MPYTRPMNEIQGAVTAAIRVQLARRGMTQAVLAEKVGMNPASLSARLTGRVLLDTRDMQLIAAAFGLDIFELLDLARAEAAPASAA